MACCTSAVHSWRSQESRGRVQSSLHGQHQVLQHIARRAHSRVPSFYSLALDEKSRSTGSIRKPLIALIMLFSSLGNPAVGWQVALKPFHRNVYSPHLHWADPVVAEIIMAGTLAPRTIQRFTMGTSIGQDVRVSAADLQQAVAQALSRRTGDTQITSEEAMSLATQLLGCDGDSTFSVEHGANLEAFADAMALYHLFSTSEDDYLVRALRPAMRVLRNAYRIYGARGVFTSFNGGKDAVVIMHLSRAVLAKHCVDQQHICRTRTIFFQSDGEFEEVEQFVDESEVAWDLELLRLDVGFVEGLKQCIAEEGGMPLGFVLGTRRGDPNCGVQAAFEPSSDWMPPFMRVNPIVEWTYGHVWHFLRLFHLPYCSLYNNGYTSLGRQADSSPNPALRKTTPEDSPPSFWPAYMLSDWTLERAGRGDGSDLNPECDLMDMDDLVRRPFNCDADSCAPGSAALIIIGDEILKGKCSDTNAPFAAKKLRAAGVPLERIVTVSDDLNAIVEEIRACMQKYDLVITSGGLGPTHDDVTIRALGDALGQRLQQNMQMDAHLRKVNSIDANASLPDEVAKLARLPELSRLLWPPGASKDGKQKWPILKCNNIFVLPGVPQFFEEHLREIVEHFIEARKVYACKVVLRVDETSIVAMLNTMVEEHPEVNFGSYPFVGRRQLKTAITLEGASPALVDAALQGLVTQLPDESILRVEQDDTLT